MALCKKEFEAETIAEAQNSADLTGEGDRALGRIADVFDSVRRIKIMPEVITFVGDNDECVLLAAKHGEFLTCHAGRFTAIFDYFDKSIDYCHRFDFLSGLSFMEIGESGDEHTPGYRTIEFYADVPICKGVRAFSVTYTGTDIVTIDVGSALEEVTAADVCEEFRRDFEWCVRKLL